MSLVFVDTSALLALMVATDSSHEKARRAFGRLETRGTRLLTSSYVWVEMYALLGRRQGLDAVTKFRAAFAPLVEVVWVDDDIHERALDLLLERRIRRLSLVDAVSFVVARDRQVEAVFAYDDDFVREGFSLVD